LSAAIAAAAPVAPKTTLLKTPGTVQAKATAAATSDTKSAKSDPATTDTLGSTLQTNTTQAAANAKPQAGADAAKAEANAASTSVSTASAHDHAPVNTTAAQTSADALDAGSQIAGAIQPQLPAPVATAPALSVTAPTNAPVPLSGLAVEIAASATAGKSHFEIRLDPADLGRIDVRIDVDHNGQVTSHLTVEKPETLSMLRQDAPQLQQALDDAGFKTGDSGLQFSLRDQSSSGQNNGNDSGRNAQRLVISEDDTIPAVTAGRTYGRMLGSSSGVDIRV
jgi:flagellar hook-length control protein FliK